LTKFLVITFSDLKKYKYFYWFAFPSFVAKPAWEISDPGWTNADGALSEDAVGFCRDTMEPSALLTNFQLKSIHQHLHTNPTPFFLIKSNGSKAEVGSLDKYEEFFANVPPLSVRDS
jgi:ubiquitin-like modifier-activating enzyme ATG7